MLRAELCAALRSAGNDARQIAKHLVSLVGALTVVGKINFPLDATLFVSLVLIFARAGTDDFCACVGAAKKRAE